MWRVYAKRVIIGLAGAIVVLTLLLYALRNDRPDITAVSWQVATPVSAESPSAVTVTWLGSTTLLFDDGETQLLIDGFFSRPSLFDILLDRPIDSHAASINHVMNEFRMRRLAAIIPVHSHFDHAMDVGAIANRSSASVLGSKSAAAIARGAGVPEDQIVIADEEHAYTFGEFTVTFRPSAHAPFGWGGSVPFAGHVEDPFVPPQAVSAYRAGRSYSVIVEHPAGTALVQGSAGFLEGELQDIAADVVLLSIGQMTALNKDYAEAYWQNTVTMTGARSVYPLHFDDYTLPFGQIEAWPKVLGNLVTAERWLAEFRDRWDLGTDIYRAEFGVPIALYTVKETES